VYVSINKRVHSFNHFVMGAIYGALLVTFSGPAGCDESRPLQKVHLNYTSHQLN